MKNETHRIGMPTLFLTLIIVILLLIPSPFAQKIFPNTEATLVKITSSRLDQVKQTGIIKQGEQLCEVEIKSGRFKGETHEATNLLMGNLENDKIYAVGDIAFAVVDYSNDQIKYINLIDHFRLHLIVIIALAFVLLLVGFAGAIGVRSLISFVLTLLTIWKILIPALLKGYSPVFVGLVITLFLTVSIITLVYGIDKRTLAACIGSSLGTILTAILSVGFVSLFKIHGAVMPYSESLLYSGFSHLDLTQIFTASIFIACSGAMMDVAVDITSAVDEVVSTHENISRIKAIKSGLNVGRAVTGTMTTTLLLAYSGGFISLFMVFMAQGTPIVNILNLKYVASEILHTLIGSFGLVTVAPFTALASGLLLGKK